MTAAVLSVLVFDFFFVRPYYTFAVSDTKYLITFAVMLGIGLLISALTARLRRSFAPHSNRSTALRSCFE